MSFAALQLEQRLGEEAQAQLDSAARQHEEYTRQLRDRLLKEREDAVEKERLAAADRVRDINERCVCVCVVFTAMYELLFFSRL